MIVVDERTVRDVVSMGAMIEAVRDVFIAADRDEAENYPVVREPLGRNSAVFGIKSGFDRSAGVLGLKAGGYWPENIRAGVANHQSTVLLFEPESGRPSALVAAGYLTALRTAAASALAARALARPGPQVLAVIGAGTQAPFQVEAMRELLPIERVVVANRSPERAERLAEALRASGLVAAAAPVGAAVQQSGVIVTVTPASAPLFPARALRPGTHISAMGADTRGKQELDPELVAEASVFTDSVEQAVTIGECQHAFAGGRLQREHIRGTLGQLLSGKAPGRRDPGETTIFDGTGVGLQDLAAAALAIDAAKRAGRAVEVQM